MGWWQTKGGERRCLPLLLEARKRLMNRMFHQTEETFHRFSEINDSLLDLSQKTCKKNVALYEAWPQASFALPPRLCAWLPWPKKRRRNGEMTVRFVEESSPTGHHHHIRAHHVLCPWSVIPSFITPLRENIIKE